MSDDQLINPLLLSNFVHQIINPMNGVLGTLDNVLDGTIKDPGRQKQRLMSVRAQLTHWIEMVRNLAFLAQLGSEDSAMALREKATEVLLPETIIEAAQFFQERASQRKLHIDLADPTTQYIVKGHVHLLRQVFINLFENALKYSDEETTILITPRPQKKTGNLIVDVANIGCGFEQSERAAIFELGYRGEAAKQINASGTGLGLFIAKRILEVAHNIPIEAEYSRASRTTTFRLRFPTYEIGKPHAKGIDKPRRSHRRRRA